MAVGLFLAIIGKVTSSWELALVATVAIVAGGIAVGISYREETGRTSAGSRLSLIMASASTRLAPSHGSPESGESDLVTSYASQVNTELASCSDLLGGHVDPSELDSARDRLVVLIANPRYGPAIERGLIDEERVREVSSRLARGG